MTRNVVIVMSAFAAIASGGCGSTTSNCRSTFACRISADAIDGIRPGMTPQEVRRRWRIPVRAPEVALGSDSVAYAAICDGNTRGWARFHGPNGGPLTLTELHFTSGAQTDRDIRLGSTRTDVSKAYGTRATPRTHSTALQVPRTPTSSLRKRPTYGTSCARVPVPERPGQRHRVRMARHDPRRRVEGRDCCSPKLLICHPIGVRIGCIGRGRQPAWGGDRRAVGLLMRRRALELPTRDD